ncbi:hypothetical protein EON64_06680 [archaeon]|nr:MAG: hypothetical protein EON64_06680 [archaeon]
MRIETGTSLPDFFERVQTELGIVGINILVGFPPAALAQDESKTVGDCVHNGETLIVQEKVLSGVQKQGVVKQTKGTRKALAKTPKVQAPPALSPGPRIAALTDFARAASVTAAREPSRPLGFGATMAR